jgi:hypothetical protein
MAANNAEAFITPIPGMLSNILLLSPSSTNIRHCCSIPFRRLSVVSYSINISITLFNPPSNALWPQGNTTENSLNNPLDWLLKAVFFDETFADTMQTEYFLLVLRLRRHKPNVGSLTGFCYGKGIVVHSCYLAQKA